MVKPRPAQPTVQFVDSYCQLYQNLFPEVRSFENFKYLHVGMISEIKRKTLPAIAKIVSGESLKELSAMVAQKLDISEKLFLANVANNNFGK